MGHKVKWCLRLLSRKNTRPDEVEPERILSVRWAEPTVFPKLCDQVPPDTGGKTCSEPKASFVVISVVVEHQPIGVGASRTQRSFHG